MKLVEERLAIYYSKTQKEEIDTEYSKETEDVLDKVKVTQTQFPCFT